MLNRLVGPALILVCTVIWGSAFVAQKLGVDHYGPFAINCYRNIIASVFLFGIVAVRHRVAKKLQAAEASRQASGRLRATVGGALCGVVLFLAMLAQQLGIERTTPGIAAFLTANYVLFVPVLSWLVGRGRPSGGVMVGVLLALCGSFFISISSTSNLAAVGGGELWSLTCAVLFAVQICLVDRYARDCDVCWFSMVQMLVAGLVALPFIFLPSEMARASWSEFVKGLPALVFLGVGSSGIAYTLQNLGQARTPPAIAAIIMSMESVFGALFGWVLLGDTMTARQLTGCGLVLFAVIFSQLISLKRSK